MEDAALTAYIAVLLALLVCSAFFSSAETALTSVNKIRLKNMARKGDARAKLCLKLLENFDSVLSTILVGNNIVNIAAASIATVVFIQFLGSKGVTVSTIVTTVVILIFGEISPKSLAKEFPEKVLLFSCRILLILTRLFTPVNFFFRQLKKALSRSIAGKKAAPAITEAELKVMVDEVASEGSINRDESDLIKSAIEFNDVRVKEILTPRVDMIACNITDSNAEIYRLFSSNSFSRLPVYDLEENNLIGLIHSKDFFSAYMKDPKFKLKKILKPIGYVHRSTKVSVVLKNMQRNKLQMAAVIDSYGSVAGIVTIEDIIEELVGEIWDEHDTAISVFHKLGPGKYLVSCDSVSRNASLRDLFDYMQLDFDLYGLENQPIAGWVVDSFGQIPQKGDSFTYQDLQVVVHQVDQNRVKEIIVTHLPEPDTHEK
ncbi:MAG: Hemolysin, contains CBS domains [Succiniclasticum sp.]|jgi:putative hemolysin